MRAQGASQTGRRQGIRWILALLLVLAGLVLPGVALAADPPENANWSQEYFDAGDGLTKLHADVLLPKAVPAGQKVPVVLTVSPYLNHAGQTTEYSTSATGPSNRFYDFLDVTDILDRGYAYVMVDLPGFGGSGGCNDWGGAREQGAVKAAVEWAASQEWSTGKVGMIGKSYDAWTGLMAIAQQPEGLAAVVSMEPVYAGYRYLYMDGVRFLNSVATPALFQVIDAKPGSPQDDPMYNLNGAPQGYCYPLNVGQQQDDAPDSAFWRERDLVVHGEGKDTPLFLTQGYLETNTKPDGAFTFFNQMTGPKRAWFGQFDHVRGWETGGNPPELLTGRGGFGDEVVRFFDRYVKGLPVEDDPVIEVQDALGRYRAERSWPPADMVQRQSALRQGTYADDGDNNGTGSGGGHGLWTFSQPLPHDAWLAGEPVVEATVDSVPRANLVANVYDVAPDGKATMISRGAMLLRMPGATQARIELYGQDWPLSAGHRIGVLLSSANSDWWTHVPTNSTVTVQSATVSLPFLSYRRDQFLPGEPTSRLESYLRSAPFNVPAETIAGGEQQFDLPPALTDAPPEAGLKRVEARLTGYTCDPAEWEFVLTKISAAPPQITVDWADGSRTRVPLAATPGSTAKYRTSEQLDSRVVRAFADVPKSWKGQFNLVQGPC